MWVSKVLRTSVNERSRLLVTPIAFWRPDKVLVSGAKPKRFFFVERKKRQNRTNMRVLRYSLYIICLSSCLFVVFNLSVPEYIYISLFLQFQTLELTAFSSSSTSPFVPGTPVFCAHLHFWVIRLRRCWVNVPLRRCCSRLVSVPLRRCCSLRRSPLLRLKSV